MGVCFLVPIECIGREYAQFYKNINDLKSKAKYQSYNDDIKCNIKI